ncbi:MAG: DHA2 family efflux MFS transporter permease subunit [Desulfovibrionaceae bacterium]|jgi:DHA2 family multidrug resistance protein|nr:DHA2 family efflux MFS transporter permease subunit [Desulfovibrionaceae bacterium]
MTAAPGAPVNKWIITLAVMIPTLVEILDTSVANVALAHIQGSLSAGQEEVTWVLTSYLVANAVVIPMSGWLARLFGRKRYLILSLVVFTGSSLLCGAAGSLFQLILFRVVQGIGGGGLQPMSQAILMETFPPHQRGMAMAVFGMGVVLGPILGPLLGGWLTDNYSWRWIFYVNLPVGMLALFMIQAFVADPEHQERRAAGEKVDYVGLALLTLGIGSLQIVLDKGQQDDWFSADYILVLSIVAGVSLLVLVFWELAHERPVVDLRIFKNLSFAAGNIVMFIGFFAFFGSIVLLPMYLQGLMGYTAFLAGMVLGPGGAVALVAMPVVGKLTQKIDARALLISGLLINGYALWSMAGFNLSIDFHTAVMARVIQGVSMPLFFVSLSYLTFAWVPVPQMNNASAIFNLLRNLGGSFGTAFVTTMLARRAQFHQLRLSEHMSALDPNFQTMIDQLKLHLSWKLGSLADHTDRAYALIYQQLQRQASAMSFNDAFLAQTVLFLCLVPLVFIMKKPPSGKRFEAGGGH